MISFARQNQLRWYQLMWWLTVITLPLPDTYNNASIILLAILWLAEGNIFKNASKLKEARWAWPFFAYFIWLIIGLLYTSDLENGFFTGEKKISFWALPMIAVTSPPLDARFISFLKKSFVYSCFII